MENKTIGETLKELEDDYSMSATLPFPSLGMTLTVRAVGPYLFSVRITDDEGKNEPAEQVLPINIIGPLIMRCSLADIAKAAKAEAGNVADEAEQYLRSL